MERDEVERRVLTGAPADTRTVWIEITGTPVLFAGADGICGEAVIDRVREHLRGSGWSAIGTYAEYGGWDGFADMLANTMWFDEQVSPALDARLRPPSAEPDAVVAAGRRWTDDDIDRYLDETEAADEHLMPELLAQFPDAVETTLSLQLGNTERRCGRAPDPSDVPAEVASSEARTDVWLLNWELEHADPPRDQIVPWMDIGAVEPTLVVTPWDEPFAMLAMYPLFASPMPLALAVFERWSRRYGVEPFTHHLTLLNVRAARRPATIEQAHGLARETELIGRDTLHLPGHTRRELAFSLLEHPHWHLHSRP